ncbi:MAG: DUF1343 domain-containing protein [Pyrinomonadaceae bacterium]|nr:DUF1343 domain-containing protein [Pyrinomonadaceae bacterium]
MANVAKKKVNISLGIERFLDGPANYVKPGERLGLICNQATVDRGFRSAADLFFEVDDLNLTTLFGPQHGIRGDVQDNMVETGHAKDPKTGLPVYSLYSETREPSEEMLRDLDTLVFDLQDIGGRVYTFIYTMAFAMKACANFGKRFVVLDRPNPINGKNVEGDMLEKGHESFVGQFPIPMRHGMTVGELASMFNKSFGIDCELEVVPMSGWNRQLYLDETDVPWVMPSPNMPTVDTAMVFPGTVYLEGTEVSEGRGTTKPFEMIGAPYIEPEAFADHLNSLGLPGVYFRATVFMPSFQKFAGEPCGGVFLHVTDRDSFRPVITGIAIIKVIIENFGEEFQWKQGAYEYEFDRNPFDVIAGNESLRDHLETGSDLQVIEDSWSKDEEEFERIRSEYLIYE